MDAWIGHARATLERDGYRLSAPRSAVVETLATLGCSVTAKEIADRLHERRVDAAEGVARYEPIDPSGEHHHHLVCQRCGQVTAFEDRELEQAIDRLSTRVAYAIDAHD